MLQKNASWWLSCLPKGWRPMRSFHWIWCFNDLYFSSKSGVKATGKASHILDTNKNTHIVSLELAKSPSYKKNSHLMLATEAQLPRSSLQWRPWDGMKAWASRASALGILHALPGHTEGWRYCHLMASTCHSHETALRIARILQMTTPCGREASERHRALDTIQGPNQEKLNAQTPSLKSLKMSLGRWHGCLYLQGLEKVNFRQMFNNHQANDV